MSGEVRSRGWRRWREATFATCTAWLVLQNCALLAWWAWGGDGPFVPGHETARQAVAWGGATLGVTFILALALAFAAWLVHAGVERPGVGRLEVDHER